MRGAMRRPSSGSPAGRAGNPACLISAIDPGSTYPVLPQQPAAGIEREGNMKTAAVSAALVLAACMVTSCGDASDPVKMSKAEDGAAVLRVIQPDIATSGLPRAEDTTIREVTLIRNFAREYGLSIKLTKVAPEQLSAELMEGRADLVIGCRLEWIDTDAKVLFSRPVFQPMRAAADSSDMGMTGEDPKVMWAVPRASKKLLKALNEYLVKVHPSVTPNQLTGDLDKIKERGYIRVLSRNNPACYFVHRGELMGFEYELIKQYAKQQ